jgi:hypothetical protein
LAVRAAFEPINLASFRNIAFACRHAASARIAVNFGAGAPHTRKVNLQNEANLGHQSPEAPKAKGEPQT